VLVQPLGVFDGRRDDPQDERGGENGQTRRNDEDQLPALDAVPLVVTDGPGHETTQDGSHSVRSIPHGDSERLFLPSVPPRGDHGKERQTGGCKHKQEDLSA